MKKYASLILDIGGVLLLPKDESKSEDKNLLNSYKELCKLLDIKGLDLERFGSETVEIYKSASRGGLSKEEALSLVSKKFKLNSQMLEKSFGRAYLENITENKELFSFLRILKERGFVLGIITTQWPVSLEFQVPKSYYELFDKIEISWIDKIRKPAEESYKLITKKLKVLPEECIFIDDKLENVEGAEKFGMKGILFKNNKQFFEELKKIGIKK